MSTHAHYEGEFGARLRHAHAAVEKAAQRVQKTTELRQAASLKAKWAATDAKKKVVQAQKTQRADHQAAAASATKRAMAARAVVFTHDQDLARHKATHDNAVTHHAAVTALAREAERKASFTPREAKAKMIGSDTPDWHFGHVMGKIREAEKEQEVAKPVTKQWSDLDRFASVPPPKYTPPPKKEWTLQDEVSRRAKRQEDLRRQSETWMKDWRLKYSSDISGHQAAQTISLPNIPRSRSDISGHRAATTISLPRATAVRLSKWIDSQR